MMGWILASLNSLRRPSRRAPRRSRSWILEDLEGRRLLSQAVQSIVTLPTVGTTKMISGPDGDLWVAVSPEFNLAAIERIGLDGSVMTFPVPGSGTEGMSIDSLTTGPDGNVWFDIDFGPGSQLVIGNVTPNGVVTEFPPMPGVSQFAGNTSIVSGPGGDVWFLGSDQTENFIGRVTTAAAVAIFPISSFSSKSPLDVYSLAVGSDGNLWFAEGMGKGFVLGRMSPSGVVTWFPDAKLPGEADVENGPNGSLIVIGYSAKGRDEVFSLSTAGVITPYEIPRSIAGAFTTYLGPADGSLWFTNASGPTRLGDITASGATTTYNLSHFVRTRRTGVFAMAQGQDGNLYVADNANWLSSPTTFVYRLAPGQLPPASGMSRPQWRR